MICWDFSTQDRAEKKTPFAFLILLATSSCVPLLSDTTLPRYTTDPNSSISVSSNLNYCILDVQAYFSNKILTVYFLFIQTTAKSVNTIDSKTDKNNEMHLSTRNTSINCHQSLLHGMVVCKWWLLSEGSYSTGPIIRVPTIRGFFPSVAICCGQVLLYVG